MDVPLPVGDDAHSRIGLRFASIGLTFPQLKQMLPLLQPEPFVSDCLQLIGRCLRPRVLGLLLKLHLATMTAY